MIGTGNRTIDLGVGDEADALEVAAEALRLDGVVAARLAPIRGRLRRWLLRQRLAGNYAPDTDGAGPGYWAVDIGGAGGNGGHGGGHGGGGHGH